MPIDENLYMIRQGFHKTEIWLPERTVLVCAVEGSGVALMCALRLRKRAPLSALKHILLSWSSNFVKALLDSIMHSYSQARPFGWEARTHRIQEINLDHNSDKRLLILHKKIIQNLDITYTKSHSYI
jgi:hypothetical protein